MLAHLGGEHFDPIGIMYSQNPFQVKKTTSKFKSRVDEHNQNVAKRRMTLNARNENDAIVESSEDFTKLEAYDEMNGGDLTFNSIKVTLPNEEEFQVKALVSSKLYFLTQQQIEKAILLSFSREDEDDEFEIDDVTLQELVQYMDFPEYRRAFTKSSALSIVHVTGGS